MNLMGKWALGLLVFSLVVQIIGVSVLQGILGGGRGFPSDQNFDSAMNWVSLISTIGSIAFVGAIVCGIISIVQYFGNRPAVNGVNISVSESANTLINAGHGTASMRGSTGAAGAGKIEATGGDVISDSFNALEQYVENSSLSSTDKGIAHALLRKVGDDSAASAVDDKRSAFNQLVGLLDKAGKLTSNVRDAIVTIRSFLG